MFHVLRILLLVLRVLRLSLGVEGLGLNIELSLGTIYLTMYRFWLIMLRTLDSRGFRGMLDYLVLSTRGVWVCSLT